MDSLEFGKKVQVGNYYILKYSKSLSKAEGAFECRQGYSVPNAIFSLQPC